MKRKPLSAGGGWPAIFYTLKKARESGSIIRMWRALSSRNACKTCALGMGGQQGGMTNEAGRFPEVCKKSVQAMAADMQGKIRDGFFQEFDFDHLARFTPRELEHSGRLVEPLIAGPNDKTYRAISWDEALSHIAGAMKQAPRDETFFYFSGRSSNEAGFLLQLVARLYGTNNVNNCSYYCHQASGVGLRSVTGSGTATITLDDLEHADLAFVIGGNPASNHPRLLRHLLDLKRRGGKVIVINPLKEIGLVNFRVPSDVRSMLFGSSIADEYIQPHIGADIALLAAVSKSLLQNTPSLREGAGGRVPASTSSAKASSPSALDHNFINNHTLGFEDFKSTIDELSWDQLERDSGVDRATIDRIAAMYAASERSVFCWTMGITHHEHGVQNVQMIANLAMLRGMLGRPGCGLLPLRGHSNVQGIGSMGAVPGLDKRFLQAMEERFHVTLPKTPGLDTLSCIERADQNRMRFSWCLGGNLYGSNPDSAFAARALNKIDTTVFLSTTLNTGHIHGRGKTTIILPVHARDEEQQSTTQESMFNYVRLSDGRGDSRPRYIGPRSEVEIIATIAREVIGDSAPLDFRAMQQHATIRESIAAIIPGYEQLLQINKNKREFHIEGRVFHEPKFKTEGGRARFHAFPLPAQKTGPDELRLMTIRSEGQFNTVVYEEEDLYRNQERRDVVLMNPADMAARGLKEDDRVTIRSATGAMEGIFIRPFNIRAGNIAMYYPEANCLIARSADPKSRTPSFKNTPVCVEKVMRLAVVSA